MPVALKVVRDDAPLEQTKGVCSKEEVSMSDKATEREALQQHDQAPKRPEKGPEVHVKKAPKRQPKQEAKPSAATQKVLEQLEEISKEIARLEGLKNDRTQLIGKLTAAKVPTATIAKAAHLSVARLRQVQAKTK
jgi:hypothetical protein